MDDSYSRTLQLWEGWADAVVAEAPATSADPVRHERADAWFARETHRPANARRRETAEPYSLEWFQRLEHYRHQRHGAWVPRLLEFAKHPGETLLGLGDGLGTDWVQYARHEAAVTIAVPSTEQLGLIRRNFELRGLPGQFLLAPPDRLPLGTASVDVACLNGLPGDTADEPDRVVAEVYRVLRPGGKVLALLPARYDAAFWRATCFPLEHYLRARRVPERPGRTFSAKSLRQLFRPFGERRIYKRQLRRSELPHVCRLLPLSLLERLMGRVLVLKAFKPLSAALPVPAAA